MAQVYLIYSATDRNDPSPSCLGAWSSRELAEAEADRLRTVYPHDIIMIDEQPLDTPWAESLDRTV